MWSMEEEDTEAVDPIVVKFTNRLSDWLFVAARYVAFQERAKEIVYKKSKD
jgi:cob(I)alamin adenosyltransferase